MATYGYSAPGSITQNLDTVLTLAFANSGNTIFDAISKNNAIFYEVKKNGMYEGIDSPEPYIEVPLMYALGNAEWYEGYDVLGTQPTEGITAVQYPWRQLACPVAVSRRESRLTAAQRIKEITKAKIEQTQLTMTETFNRAFLEGSINQPDGTLYTPVSSPTTGRSGIEPIGALINWQVSVAQPTSSLVVGGLNQSERVWWRNWCSDAQVGKGGSAITTYAELLFMFELMFKKCSRGPGGPPKVILTDETTSALLNAAYYDKYRRSLASDNDYPFDNLLFHGARVVTDELMCDVKSAAAGTTLYGTAYFVNPDFMKIKYDSQCNFILTDMQKPVNQDSKVAHSLWMGNCVMTNRRKHGVIGGIPRTSDCLIGDI